MENRIGLDRTDGQFHSWFNNRKVALDPLASVRPPAGVYNLATGETADVIESPEPFSAGCVLSETPHDADLLALAQFALDELRAEGHSAPVIFIVNHDARYTEDGPLNWGQLATLERLAATFQEVAA